MLGQTGQRQPQACAVKLSAHAQRVEDERRLDAEMMRQDQPIEVRVVHDHASARNNVRQERGERRLLDLAALPVGRRPADQQSLETRVADVTFYSLFSKSVLIRVHRLKI